MSFKGKISCPLKESVESDGALTLVYLYQISNIQKARATFSTESEVKTKTNRDLLARVFVHLTLNECICSEF